MHAWLASLHGNRSSGTMDSKEIGEILPVNLEQETRRIAILNRRQTLFISIAFVRLS